MFKVGFSGRRVCIDFVVKERLKYILSEEKHIRVSLTLHILYLTSGGENLYIYIHIRCICVLYFILYITAIYFLLYM